MVATVAQSASSEYYLRRTEHVFATPEPQGRWVAVGPGLDLRQSGPVEPLEFERLLEARDAAGRTLLHALCRRSTRRSAFDVTFSAPKSVSVLWALSSPDLRLGIEQAQQQAVEAAIRALNDNAAFCRRGQGGRERQPVRLTVAAFRHGEARPAEHRDGLTFSDPDLHHHAVVLNLGQAPGRGFGAIDGRPLFAFKMACGAIYRAELACGLQALGLSIEVRPPNGLFDLAGVDTRLCAYFSARRSQVQARLAAKGIARSADAPALAAAQARNTRGTKASSTAAAVDRHRFWRERAAALGFPPDEVVHAALEQGKLAAKTLLPGSIERAVKGRMASLEHEYAIAERPAALYELIRAVASALVGAGVRAAHIAREVDRLRVQASLGSADEPNGTRPAPHSNVHTSKRQ
jgi:conjugative relaxase-like TrwC/TraI family protein